jgi:hypothetical protein
MLDFRSYWKFGNVGDGGSLETLENGRRWRMAVAGKWQSLENGSRWRMVGAGEMLSQEKSGR